MKKKASKTRVKRLGDRITDGLTELLDVLKRGEPVERHFRVDHIEIPDPPAFKAADVKRLRARLAMTQRLFAKLIGVSSELVEHWEQGIRSPRPIACRLLNEIARDPTAFLQRLPKSTGRSAA